MWLRYFTRAKRFVMVVNRAERPRSLRRGRSRRRESDRITILLVGIAVLVSGLAGLGIMRARHGAHATLTMDQARAFNAAVPFVPGPIAPAPRFRFHGSPASRLQAVECLATAAIYEAGDDPREQKAVMQVVLNRVRSPGYPNTVCGVVYQGAALKTGCQFSFACDGSLQRRPEHDGWTAARRLATRALSGSVDDEVGTATHYHTDWVVPYWIGSLDKIAKVRTHIFYRPRAARQRA